MEESKRMVEMEASPISPLVLRNLLTSIFIYADESLSYIAQKYKVLQFLRSILISAFLFFLRVLPCIFASLNLNSQQNLKSDDITNFPNNTIKGGESGIGRALSQLLWIINDLPVSSRKYETVRSLAEMLIDENLLEGCETLREVNCSVLSIAFSRTLTRLEARVAVMDYDGVGELNYEPQPQSQPQPQPAVYYKKLNRVLRTVWYYGGVVWTGFGRPRDELSRRTGSSAEKMTAELLWMAQKLAASGGGAEAVFRWASATKLAAMALSAEPRLQGSLVKVSAFLLRQAKEMGGEEKAESKREQERHTKMKLLISWLPLLCRASGGQDAPVLSTSEKTELERVLENIIESLEQEEEQEKVLSLWLHHFTHCLSSDWPNLHSCYTRWCNASRILFLHQLQYKYIEKKLL